MSFVKTLATLAVGFAAARGVDHYKKIGGMEGVKGALRGVGEPGGMADQVGQMAEKMGVPGGKTAVRDLFAKFGTSAAGATEATEAGLGSLVAALTGAATAGAKTTSDMLGALTGGTPADAMMEDNARLMIRAMIQAVKSDGVIDEAERMQVLAQLKDATPEEIAFVKAEMDAPIDIAALAAATGVQARAQVYSAALMAIRVDTDAERAYLHSLATALGLDAATVAGLHSTMGRPGA
ncbi:tellurite resistance TerB family protein [Candidatus Falkowbacteria bacterium]|nr:tellurite resistance TerB family protein [Candidatus Falkowbacteria bacterium]